MAGQYKKCCEYQSKDHLSPTTALQHVADVKCQSVSCRASSFHLLTLAAADTVGWWPVWFHILGFILSKMGVKVYTLNPQNIRMGESFSHTGQVQKKTTKEMRCLVGNIYCTATVGANNMTTVILSMQEGFHFHNI